ncbi:hypothetical protein K402DRAFT_359858 [Aulographum hederae CBS 113979]|uniref:Cora-domain-containing protein n=1 Tax=Aulographum hederae CBS 113979 TaxID=1176131 RepID=A0A6G1GSY2_9PEZI|nr:hypothetical protein K402DRAFT_359858 [Aulographum hederae CBS 113979]
MALDAETAKELVRKLTADRDAYLDSLNRTHELLLQIISSSATVPYAPSVPRLTADVFRQLPTTTLDVESVQKGSGYSGDFDSDTDDGQSLFVQTPLDLEEYSEEGFRKHLKTHPWTFAGKEILYDIFEDGLMHQKGSLIPNVPGEVPDRSHITHYSIFDVCDDGTPTEIKMADTGPMSRSLAIWNRIKSINSDPKREQKAVGRITIVREPSPLLFAALHYTMHKHFDVDEMFQFLVDDDPALAKPHRAFSEDHRHQRTFVFNMEYYTVLGEGCVPQRWQRFDSTGRLEATHIPITRCGSVVALSLEGPPMGKVRNKDRRIQKKYGYVYDPFSPWRVLSMQAYPDWNSSIDSHDNIKHYVNGPEAFLVTVRAELKDAAKRLLEVYRAISDLVEPPPDFIFNLSTRDKLLFEDVNFTYSRRYFWAGQTLGIMNQDIRDMIETYESVFKDSVWDGTNKIIWPGSGDGSTSSRQAHWNRRLGLLRSGIEDEIGKLKTVEALNEKKMKIIKGLHENLFNGTSVHESRRSIEQAEITVAQGNNIKLLTLVTIFFLPLTFVTSVFGMTNMPPNDNFNHFAYTLVAICIPTYILIGSLNTDSGMKFWTTKSRYFWSSSGHGLAKALNAVGYQPKWARNYHKMHEEDAHPSWKPRHRRSGSLERKMISRFETNGGMPVFSPERSKIPPPLELGGDMENGEREEARATFEERQIRFLDNERPSATERDYSPASKFTTGGAQMSEKRVGSGSWERGAEESEKGVSRKGSLFGRIFGGEKERRGRQNTV